MNQINLWLVYREEDCNKNEWYIKHYIELGQQMGIRVSLVLTKELLLGIGEKCYVTWTNHEKECPDAAVIRTIDPKLSHHFELSGIRIFNSATVSKICNDKALTYETVNQLGVNSIPTLMCKHDLLKETMMHVSLPSVVKTVDGHGGQEVFLVQQDLDMEIEKILSMTKSDFVIQPLIGHKNQDLRVYILGNRVLGCVLRTSRGEFKANYSLGGKVCSYELSEQQLLLVNKIVHGFNFDLVGIDFIIGDDDTLIFNEIEDVVGARMLYECSNIDIVECYLKYIKETIGA